MIKALIFVGKTVRRVVITFFMCIAYIIIGLLSLIFTALGYEPFTTFKVWNETWISCLRDLWGIPKPLTQLRRH